MAQGFPLFREMVTRTERLKSGAVSRFEVVRRRRAETRRRYALARPGCMSYNTARLAAT